MKLLPLIAALLISGQPFQKISFERLPDMQTARGAHRTVILDGEITVFGGHTNGFKPVETAEYYSGGAWHTMPMMYPHDGACIALMPGGNVFLAGGSGEPFGIGQSWGAEIYDRATHSFSPIGILSHKRAYASALAMPDSSVVIAGNWYAADGIEVYDRAGGLRPVKDLQPGWNAPYILPTAPGEAIVFGWQDCFGAPSYGRVDRLNGDSYIEPILQEWRPHPDYTASDTEFKIADYTYLLNASRLSDGQEGILRVSGGEFSLLETEEPIPMTGLEGDTLKWGLHLYVDRPARHAWLPGMDERGRVYFACIHYDATFDGGKAPVSLYYAENPSGCFPTAEMAMPADGTFVLTGGPKFAAGKGLDHDQDNFNPSAEVYIFHTGPQTPGASLPVWTLVAGVLLFALSIWLAYRAFRARKPARASDVPPDDKARKLNADLMEQLDRMMEEKELFKRSDLRLSDVASELATNRTYMSILVNNLTGSGFSDLINGYRIRYAQKLMLEHPDMVHGDVAIASGFASRTAFLRTFKAKTGMSPTEWKKSQE